MRIKSEYAGTKLKPYSASGRGGKFVYKVFGVCPKGSSEVTAGGRKGQCYRGTLSDRASSRGASGPSDSSGPPGSGSKFVEKANGKCPGGIHGSRRKRQVGELLHQKNAGSIYRVREVGSCPEGTTLITSGDRKGMCLDRAKVLSREHGALRQELR